MKIQEIKLSDITPNDYNPNVMDVEKMEVLKNNIREKGFLQPIIVKSVEGEMGKYTIIDGEHRYRVMKQLGFETIPSIVQEGSEMDAMIQTVNMNNLRGDMDTIKLAHVIADIKKELSSEEIKNLMGYSEGDLIRFEDVIALDVSSITDKKEEVKEEESKEEIVDKIPARFFQFSKKQYDLVLRALHKHGGGRDIAFVDICKQFIMKSHPDVYAKVKEVEKAVIMEEGEQIE